MIEDKQQQLKPEEAMAAGDSEAAALLSLLEDLQTERRAMEEQRKATLNILEDVNEAQSELKRKYQEADVVKELIQALGDTLDAHALSVKVIAAIRKLLPDHQIAYLSVPSGQPADQAQVFFDGIEPVSKEYVKAIVDAMEEFAVKDTVLKAAGFRCINDDCVFLPPANLELTTDQQLPGWNENFPWFIPGVMVGIVNLSSRSARPASQHQQDSVRLVLDNANLMVGRIKNLVASEQARFGNMVESMVNGVVMFDLERHIVVANRSARHWFGEMLLGLSIENFVGLFAAKAQAALLLSEAINQILADGQTAHVDELIHKSGIFEVWVAAVRDYQNKLSGGVIIFHDVTRLKEVDKMKTDFVSVVSHQLRTPLTAIKLFAETLADEEVGKLNEQQAQYLDDLRASADRLINLVNDLLNMSRLESGRMRIATQATDYPAFLASVVKDAEVLLPAGGKLSFINHQSSLAPVEIDQRLLREVVYNLITNAIRYSPKNRCLIEVILDRAGEELVLAVKDQGIGIPLETQPKLFEKFFRADEAIKSQSDGSGLGLYVAKMILDASGGRIWLESAGADQGTTFFVAIPTSGMKAKGGEVGLAAD